MKRVFFVVMLLLGLGIFCSCDKIGSGGKYGKMVGYWVEDYELPYTSSYVEFTKSGAIYVYYLPGKAKALFENGVLYTLEYYGSLGLSSDYTNPTWEKEFAGEYHITDGLFIGPEMSGLRVEIINNDTLGFIDDDYNKTYYYYRIKDFKTKRIDTSLPFFN